MVDEDGQISEAELAAFADGSLSPRRRAQVAACIERSPELHVLVGAQRAALAAVRALDAPAPARLRARLQPEPSRPHVRLRTVPLAIAAAMAVLLAVVLPLQCRRNEPTMLEIADLADRSPGDAWRTRRDGTELRHLRRGEQTIVTWLRAGHTCVLSGARLSRDELLELATWNGSMDIARIHTGLSPTSLHELAA